MGNGRKPMKGVTQRTAYACPPQLLSIDYATNSSRSLLYDTPEEIVKFVGPKCPYTLNTIERRMQSLLDVGQEQAIRIYLTATGRPVVVSGFLRATAFLLAAARGVLGDIPKAEGKILATNTTAPKKPADYLALAAHNYTENAEREELSPVDKAYYLERLSKSPSEGGFGLTKEDAASRVGLSKRGADRYLQLLSLHPVKIAEVHEGKTTMSAALKKSSIEGTGTSKSPRTYVKHSNMSRALKLAETRTPPEHELGPAQLVQLAAILAGETLAAECEDECVVAWANWLDADKSEEPPKEPRARKKTPPPTIDEQVAT